MPESISSTGSGEQLFFNNIYAEIKERFSCEKKKNKKKIIPTPDLKS